MTHYRTAARTELFPEHAVQNMHNKKHVLDVLQRRASACHSIVLLYFTYRVFICNSAERMCGAKVKAISQSVRRETRMRAQIGRPVQRAVMVVASAQRDDYLPGRHP